jgi:hypothetical protein
MVDLSAEMPELWASVGSPTPGRARVFEFIAARDGEGVSTVAREFAFHAAHALGQRVWLVDLDLMAQSQAASLAQAPERFGVLGPPASASPDGSMFFSVRPPLRRPDGRPWADARFICARSVGGTSLWVTEFRREAMRSRQGVHVLPSGDYWSALRRHADVIVVDAPAAERSQAGITLAQFMDEVILVVDAEQGDLRASGRLRDAVTEAGGHCAGLFCNRVGVDWPEQRRRVLS